MQRTRRVLAVSALCILYAALDAPAVTKPFHLQLTSNAAAAFPLLDRFGAITIDIYPHGFRARSVWLRGFALNGQRTITVENPISRTYVVMPISDMGELVRMIGGREVHVGPPQRVEVAAGRVGGLPSRRYRVVYGPGDFIDVWTTSSVGPAPALRACLDALMRAVAPSSAAAFRAIPDTPVYVEVNVGKYRKLPILRTTGLTFSAAGEAKALRVSPWMFPAPFGTIFK